MNQSIIITCFAVGIITIILAVVISSILMIKMNKVKIKKTRIIYIEKLGNSDSSIKNAMQYLELTNSINERESSR